MQQELPKLTSLNPRYTYSAAVVVEAAVHVLAMTASQI